MPCFDRSPDQFGEPVGLLWSILVKRVDEDTCVEEESAGDIGKEPSGRYLLAIDKRGIQNQFGGLIADLSLPQGVALSRFVSSSKGGLDQIEALRMLRKYEE